MALRRVFKESRIKCSVQQRLLAKEILCRLNHSLSTRAANDPTLSMRGRGHSGLIGKPQLQLLSSCQPVTWNEERYMMRMWPTCKARNFYMQSPFQLYQRFYDIESFCGGMIQDRREHQPDTTPAVLE